MRDLNLEEVKEVNGGNAAVVSAVGVIVGPAGMIIGTVVGAVVDAVIEIAKEAIT